MKDKNNMIEAHYQMGMNSRLDKMTPKAQAWFGLSYLLAIEATHEKKNLSDMDAADVRRDHAQELRLWFKMFCHRMPKGPAEKRYDWQPFAEQVGAITRSVDSYGQPLREIPDYLSLYVSENRTQIQSAVHYNLDACIYKVRNSLHLI